MKDLYYILMYNKLGNTKECKTLIKQGFFQVNGVVETNCKRKIQEEDILIYQGKKLKSQPFHYLMVVSIVIIILSIFFTLLFAFNRNNNYLLCLIASCIGLLLFSISLLGIYIVRMMFVITQTPQYMISEITEENID